MISSKKMKICGAKSSEPHCNMLISHNFIFPTVEDGFGPAETQFPTFQLSTPAPGAAAFLRRAIAIPTRNLSTSPAAICTSTRRVFLRTPASIRRSSIPGPGPTSISTANRAPMAPAGISAPTNGARPASTATATCTAPTAGAAPTATTPIRRTGPTAASAPTPTATTTAPPATSAPTVTTAMKTTG